jgi:hypothetical protein
MCDRRKWTHEGHIGPGLHADAAVGCWTHRHVLGVSRSTPQDESSKGLWGRLKLGECASVGEAKQQGIRGDWFSLLDWVGSKLLPEIGCCEGDRIWGRSTGTHYFHDAEEETTFADFLRIIPRQGRSSEQERAFNRVRFQEMDLSCRCPSITVSLKRIPE